MADKSFIQMKLDKDNALNELKQVVPGLRALQYYHNNPDSSFVNTLDLLAEDVVPFYAAHKYGAEPEDYVKEAFLLGMTPAKAQQLKNYIKKHPNSTRYENLSNELYDLAPNGNSIGDRVNKPGYRGNFANEEMNRVMEGEPYTEYKNVNDVLTDIEESLNSPIKEDLTTTGFSFMDPNHIKNSSYLSKLQVMQDKLDRLEYLNQLKETVTAQKEFEAYNNLSTPYGTVNSSTVDNILSQIDKDYKLTTNEINLYNSNIDFQPEREPYPYMDPKKSYDENINKFMEEQTSNMKLPWQSYQQ